MIAFWMILIHNANAMDKYSYCIKLLEGKIPIKKNQQETKLIMKKYSNIFDKHPPTYKEKEKICLDNRKLFERVARYILDQTQLGSQMTEKQMARCISRSVSVFAYTIVTMHDSQFSNDLDKIKKDFLSAKNSQQSKGHKYVLPQINKNDRSFSEFFVFPDDNHDLTTEQRYEDLFLSEFSSDNLDDLL